jgi:hypothetical protein
VWRRTLSATTPPVGNSGRYVCRGPDGIAREHYLIGVRVPRGAAPADQWEQHCEAAHAATHDAITASDLDGCMLGDAFMNCVIYDSKVRACGEWLCLEYPEFRPLFDACFFPGQTINSPYGPWTIVTGDQWPVVLDANNLCWDLERVASRGECHDRSPAPPTRSNSFFQTAQAIANRHKALFDLLRGPDVIAAGTSEATFSLESIQQDQWSRPDRYLDVKLSDLISIRPGKYRRMLSGIKVTLVTGLGSAVNAPAITTLEGPDLDEAIRGAIHAINDEACRSGKKLNIKEQRIFTMRRLRERGIRSRAGHQATVEKILDEPEFKATRGPVGVRRTPLK